MSADGEQHSPTQPSLTLGACETQRCETFLRCSLGAGCSRAGYRGAVALRVEARTAAGDLHSGSFGGSVANAAHALAAVLAALHAPDGAVAAPAFYADVAPLTAAQRDAFRALPRNDAADKASAGALPHSAPPHAPRR